MKLKIGEMKAKEIANGIFIFVFRFQKVKIAKVRKM